VCEHLGKVFKESKTRHQSEESEERESQIERLFLKKKPRRKKTKGT